MSQLHPTEDDEAFAQMHADAGHKACIRQLEVAEKLLLRALLELPKGSKLRKDIQEALPGEGWARWLRGWAKE